jgi:predicted regulator of Ras-like GTPase activity (Roadblock/LC7/MglB family)
MQPHRSPFAKILSDLTRLQGVTGALIASESDAIPIDSTMQVGGDAEALAALAISVFRKARLAGAAAGNGHLVFVQLDADHGRICVSGRGELLLVTISNPLANVGLVRVAMLTAVRAAIFDAASLEPR